MININTAYTFLLLQANKNYGGQFTPSRFNTAWRQSEISFFWNCFGFDEQSRGNQHSNNNYAVSTQVNEESLRPFYNTNVTLNINTGIGVLPTNYAYIDVLTTQYNSDSGVRIKEVIQLDQAELMLKIKRELPELLVTAGAGDIDKLIQPIKEILTH